MLHIATNSLTHKRLLLCGLFPLFLFWTFICMPSSQWIMAPSSPSHSYVSPCFRFQTADMQVEQNINMSMVGTCSRRELLEKAEAAEKVKESMFTSYLWIWSSGFLSVMYFIRNKSKQSWKLWEDQKEFHVWYHSVFLTVCYSQSFLIC